MVKTQPRYHDTIMDTQAITIRLPADIYEKLRRDAFDQRTSMNAIINEELTSRYFGDAATTVRTPEAAP